MEATQWVYFQFRRGHDYPVYLRFQSTTPNQKLFHIVKEMGFEELLEKESKKISLHRPFTRILTVQEASARLQLQLNGPAFLDKYGTESISLQGTLPVYTYKKAGIMVLYPNKVLWDLGLHSDIIHTEQMVGVRIIFTRFLAMALAELGVLCYWGTTKEDSIFIMKQEQSFGEAVFIDISKGIVFSNEGASKLKANTKIIRKDKESSSPSTSIMSREELISYLSVSTCLLSFSGITAAMKKSIYDLSSKFRGTYSSADSSPNL